MNGTISVAWQVFSSASTATGAGSTCTSYPNCSRCGTATSSSRPCSARRKETSARSGPPPADRIQSTGVKQHPTTIRQPTPEHTQGPPTLVLFRGEARQRSRHPGRAPSAQRAVLRWGQLVADRPGGGASDHQTGGRLDRPARLHLLAIRRAQGWVKLDHVQPVRPCCRTRSGPCPCRSGDTSSTSRGCGRHLPRPAGCSTQPLAAAAGR